MRAFHRWLKLGHTHTHTLTHKEKKGSPFKSHEESCDKERNEKDLI